MVDGPSIDPTATLSVEAFQPWSGFDGCNAFGFVRFDNGRLGTWHNEAWCSSQERTNLVFEIITNAEAASIDGDQLIVESDLGALKFLPRALVPRSAAELAQAMVSRAEPFETDPAGPLLTFGLAVPDASCRPVWETHWPGPAAGESFDIHGPLVLPAMAYQVRIAVFDDAGEARDRAAEATSLLEQCAAARPDDTWSELVLDTAQRGNIVATSRATRTHMHDPYGHPSESPMQRTTNIAVAVLDGVVVSFVGVQAGVTPVDPQFGLLVDSTLSQIDTVLSEQMAALEYQASR